MQLQPVAIGLGLFVVMMITYLALLTVAYTSAAYMFWTPYIVTTLCAIPTGYLATSDPLAHFVILGFLESIAVAGAYFVSLAIGPPGELLGWWGPLLSAGRSCLSQSCSR